MANYKTIQSIIINDIKSPSLLIVRYGNQDIQVSISL